MERFLNKNSIRLKFRKIKKTKFFLEWIKNLKIIILFCLKDVDTKHKVKLKLKLKKLALYLVQGHTRISKDNCKGHHLN